MRLIVCLWVCMCTTCVQFQKRPEEGVGSPGLDLQMVVGYQNWTQVLQSVLWTAEPSISSTPKAIWFYFFSLRNTFIWCHLLCILGIIFSFWFFFLCVCLCVPQHMCGRQRTTWRVSVLFLPCESWIFKLSHQALVAITFKCWTISLTPSF